MKQFLFDDNFVNWLKHHGEHPLDGWSDEINIVGVRNEKYITRYKAHVKHKDGV